MDNTSRSLAPNEVDPAKLPSATWQHKTLAWFSEFAGQSAMVIGSASAFVVATLSVIVWAATGPFFHYSDTWQLVINTGTTVITFLAVFLIQHSQNRDGKAIQLKLDELIRCTESARNRLIDLEHCTEEEMERIQTEFARHKKS